MIARSLICAAAVAMGSGGCTPSQPGRQSVVSAPADSLAPISFGCKAERPGSTPKECDDWAVEMVDRGEGARAAEAVATLEALCAAGYASSCVRAAEANQLGIGRAPDPKLQQHLREEACRLGMAAQCRPAVAERAAVLADQRADALLRCQEGEAPGCTEYGALLWDGDRSSAGLPFFERACKLGDAPGCRRAAAAKEALNGEGPW